MWRADSTRDAMPLSGPSWPSTLPTAWRAEHRSSNGRRSGTKPASSLEARGILARGPGVDARESGALEGDAVVAGCGMSAAEETGLTSAMRGSSHPVCYR
jgi:hypothetical protein